VEGFFTRDSSKDVKSRKHEPFGVIKLKFHIKPLFIHKNSQNLAQNGLGFFSPEMLNNGDAKSKFPQSPSYSRIKVV